MAYLLGKADPPEMNTGLHPIDSWRVGIINFLRDYWHTVQPQLKCPAKGLMTDNPNPCFGCLDAQVITCLSANSSNEQRIQQYKPRG